MAESELDLLERRLTTARQSGNGTAQVERCQIPAQQTAQSQQPGDPINNLVQPGCHFENYLT
jgi:hypothetical protein